MTLSDFFREHPKAALAFSGGVDSAYLLWAGLQSGADILPCYVSTPFQPEFEKRDAQRLAGELGISLTVIDFDNLAIPHIAQNGADRCYHCKKAIFGQITQTAQAAGYPLLLDGTNASDEEGDRPGTQAAKELSVLSPLRMAGLTKDEIRRRSKEAGLFTWNKPAYSCLATRLSTGEVITKEKLQRTEQAEELLFSLGFTDFRVRTFHGAAEIQIKEAQLDRLMANKAAIRAKLKELYTDVLLDLEGR